MPLRTACLWSVCCFEHQSPPSPSGNCLLPRFPQHCTCCFCPTSDRSVSVFHSLTSRVRCFLPFLPVCSLFQLLWLLCQLQLSAVGDSPASASKAHSAPESQDTLLFCSVTIISSVTGLTSVCESPLIFSPAFPPSTNGTILPSGNQAEMPSAL